MKHRCATLRPVKVSDSRINYVCYDCGEIVAWTDDEVKAKAKTETKEYPKITEFSKRTLESMK